MAKTRLIVGLGNPGKQYDLTRHNLGFMVLDRIARQDNLVFKSQPKYKALLTKFQTDNGFAFLMAPLTFMNVSGEAVAPFVNDHGLDLSEILIVTDDLALPFGVLRLKSQGSAGGHNGLRDLIQKLGSQTFPRLRMGIDQPAHPSAAKDYVLGKFTSQEQKQLPEFVERAADACRCWLDKGINEAMSSYNQRNDDE